MRIEIRTTPEEKRRWQEIAENKGVSLSELVRSALGGQRLRKRREPPRVDPDLLRELARMGNNLNQLARAANRRHSSDIGLSLPSICRGNPMMIRVALRSLAIEQMRPISSAIARR